MNTARATTDLKTLKTPLLCWHESLLSARNDALVALSTESARISTTRPLPPGTAVFLELEGGASIDAITTEGDSGGFVVEFVTVDDAATQLIDRALRDIVEPRRRASDSLVPGPITHVEPARAPTPAPMLMALPVLEPPVDVAPVLARAPTPSPVLVELPPVVDVVAPPAAVVEEAHAAIVEAPAPFVAEESAALVEEPAPVAEEPAALVEAPAPVVEEPAAVVEESAAVEESAVVVEEPAAVVEELAAVVVEELAAVVEEPVAIVDEEPAAPLEETASTIMPIVEDDPFAALAPPPLPPAVAGAHDVERDVAAVPVVNPFALFDASPDDVDEPAAPAEPITEPAAEAPVVEAAAEVSIADALRFELDDDDDDQFAPAAAPRIATPAPQIVDSFDDLHSDDLATAFDGAVAPVPAAHVESDEDLAAAAALLGGAFGALPVAEPTPVVEDVADRGLAVDRDSVEFERAFFADVLPELAEDAAPPVVEAPAGAELSSPFSVAPRTEPMPRTRTDELFALPPAEAPSLTSPASGRGAFDFPSTQPMGSLGLDFDTPATGQRAAPGPDADPFAGITLAPPPPAPPPPLTTSSASTSSTTATAEPPRKESTDKWPSARGIVSTEQAAVAAVGPVGPVVVDEVAPLEAVGDAVDIEFTDPRVRAPAVTADAAHDDDTDDVFAVEARAAIADDDDDDDDVFAAAADDAIDVEVDDDEVELDHRPTPVAYVTAAAPAPGTELAPPAIESGVVDVDFSEFRDMFGQPNGHANSGPVVAVPPARPATATQQLTPVAPPSRPDWSPLASLPTSSPTMTTTQALTPVSSPFAALGMEPVVPLAPATPPPAVPSTTTQRLTSFAPPAMLAAAVPPSFAAMPTTSPPPSSTSSSTSTQKLTPVMPSVTSAATPPPWFASAAAPGLPRAPGFFAQAAAAAGTFNPFGGDSDARKADNDSVPPAATQLPPDERWQGGSGPVPAPPRLLDRGLDPLLHNAGSNSHVGASVPPQPLPFVGESTPRTSTSSTSSTSLPPPPQPPPASSPLSTLAPLPPRRPTSQPEELPVAVAVDDDLPVIGGQIVGDDDWSSDPIFDTVPGKR